MAVTRIDGRAVEYEVHGTGDPLVLLQPTWWPLDPWKLSGLPELSSSNRVVLFNQRGVGASAGTGTEYGLDSVTEDTLALLDDLAIPKAHLVTFANGSMVALRLAQLAPDRVRSVVLGAPGAPYSRAPRAVPEARRLHALEHGFEAFVKGHAANDDFAFSPAGYKAHPERASSLAGALWDHAQSADEYFKHALVRTGFDVLKDIDRVTQPALVITGADDTVERGDSNPVESSRLLASRIPNARLELIPGLRHMLYWEAPDACWPVVTRFLENWSS